jgi:hypothetical protein
LGSGDELEVIRIHFNHPLRDVDLLEGQVQGIDELLLATDPRDPKLSRKSSFLHFFLREIK